MRLFLTLALFALPGVALAQGQTEPPKTAKVQKVGDSSDRRLEALEARLEALLKEIHDLRGGKKVEIEKKEVVGGAAGKGQPLRLELKLDDKGSGKGITLSNGLTISGKPEIKDKKEFKYRVVEGKGIVVEIPAASVKTDAKDKGKRVVVVDEGAGKPGPTTATTHFYRVETREDANTVQLTRVTYTLAADKAKALDSFLKQNAKAKVLETKLDGDKLIITTTPDVQTTIGQVVALMKGEPVSSRAIFRYDVERTAPAVPKPPVAPKAPEKPKPPVAK